MKKLTIKQQKKVDDDRINTAYRAGCCNIQINMMDIPKVFAVGQKAINEGASDEALASLVRAYIEQIRQN